MKVTAKSSLTPLICALSLMFAGCSSEKQTGQVSPKDEVKDSITKMVNAIDTKQWHIATARFDNKVFVDYQSLSGQPGAITTADVLVGGWQQLLAKVNTHHILSNFEIDVAKDAAESYSHVYASHQAEGLDFWDAYGRYHHKLKKVNGEWKITSMKLIMHGQKGNLNFLTEVIQMNESLNTQSVRNTEALNRITKEKVEFLSEGEKIVGNIYYPADYEASRKYSAVIVSGSWTTVKEQMAGLYAERLAAEGFVTLAFDFRNFGESAGAVRFYENPSQKVKDISSAVSYLSSLPSVDSERVGALGICAGAMYTLMAASEDKRIKSVVTVASWLHDAEAVKLFYGGEDGVKNKIDAAKAAKVKYADSGFIEYIPSISTTDQSAAMFGPYDYYLNPERGAVPEWSNDKFAVATWEDWLTLDPMPSAEKLQAPTLMIHSDGSVLPQYTKNYFEKIATSDKSLHWIETTLKSPFHQFSFYDQDAEVKESIEQAKNWFEKKL